MWLMKRFAQQKELVNKWFSEVGPRVQEKLEQSIKDSASCIAHYSGNMEYQVIHAYGAQFAVNLKERTCSCHKWELNGIPCCHAVQAIFRREENPQMYVSQWYKKESMKKAYGGIIKPFRDQERWPKSSKKPLLPLFHKQAGRPKKLRRKGLDETIPSNTKKLKRYHIRIHCSNSGKEGHNKRSCASRQHAKSISACLFKTFILSFDKN